MSKPPLQENPELLLDPHALLPRLLEYAVQSFGADSGSLMLLNPNTGSLDIEADYGLSARARKTKLRPGEGVTGWVASTGQVLRIEDVSKDRRYIPVDPRIRSEMAAPLTVRGQVIGILNVDSTKLRTFTSSQEKQFLRFANAASRSIRLSWEINNLRVKGDQLESLVNMGQAIISQDNLDAILQRIANESCRLMKARLCSLMLLSEDGEQLILKSWSGASRAYIKKPNLPVADSLVGVVIRRLKPLAVLNVQDNQRYQHTELARREGLVSLLSVPLAFEGKALGALTIYTAETHRFSNEEIRLISAMAGLSAVAIAKARLLERVLLMEEDLKASERLSALGWLAAEIAHEIRNPLTVLQMVFHSMLEEVQLNESAARDATLIQNKMKQMNRILDQVLTFARSSEPVRECLNPATLLDDIILLTRHKLAEQGISIDHKVNSDIAEIRGDRAQLEQAVLNLVLNAVQAMPNGGKLSLSIHPAKASKKKDFVAIQVKDNGKGISKQQQEDLFQPFLSHRPGGTGLGLALVNKTVQNHGGTIQVKSSKGKGTCFTLLLPAV